MADPNGFHHIPPQGAHQRRSSPGAGQAAFFPQPMAQVPTGNVPIIQPPTFPQAQHAPNGHGQHMPWPGQGDYRDPFDQQQQYMPEPLHPLSPQYPHFAQAAFVGQQAGDVGNGFLGAQRPSLHLHPTASSFGDHPQPDDGDDAEVPLLSPQGQQTRPVSTRWSTGNQLPSPGGFDSRLPGAPVDMDDATYQRFQGNGDWAHVPQTQPRRRKNLRRVPLYKGNLVVDCPVPPKLLEQVHNKQSQEFTHLRYTAATCDPDNFVDEGYELRQVLYSPKRHTELHIVVTMYNESDVHFKRTMRGIYQNIRKMSKSAFWGADGWQKVVVCIVADGETKCFYIDKELNLEFGTANALPVQTVFCLKKNNAKKINSHRWFFNAFSRLLNPTVCILLDVGTQPLPKSIYRLWGVFHRNKHVGGACGEIVAQAKWYEPFYKPVTASQNFEYKMSNILDKPFESVCGYIGVLPGAFSAYRYKALQSVYVTGAGGSLIEEGPLLEYFKGEQLHHDLASSVWTQNMYLAEDRILCWQLVAKRDAKWLLHYERGSAAITDVPDNMPELVNQRRRWVNGSFFATLHALCHFHYIYRSKHSFSRKVVIHFQLLYQAINLFFSLFAVANWFIILQILTNSLIQPLIGMQNLEWVNIGVKYCYIVLLLCCFILALGNKPKASRWFYYIITTCFALVTAYMMFAAVYITYVGISDVVDTIKATGRVVSVVDLFKNNTFASVAVSLASTYGLYLIASLWLLDPLHMITSFYWYLLLAPSFTNIINVYAFCNINDVSWGNRPEEAPKEVKAAISVGNSADVELPTNEVSVNDAYEKACKETATKPEKEREKEWHELSFKEQTELVSDKNKALRTNCVLIWLILNGGLAIAILASDAGGGFTKHAPNRYMTFLLYFVAVMAAIRFIGTVAYSISWVRRRRAKPQSSAQD
ncbi:hypothetical protein JCM10207_007714 [Rhodosporidiobolus poonsookiae]